MDISSKCGASVLVLKRLYCDGITCAGVVFGRILQGAVHWTTHRRCGKII